MKAIAICSLVGAAWLGLGGWTGPLSARGGGVNDEMQADDYRLAGLQGTRDSYFFGVQTAPAAMSFYAGTPYTAGYGSYVDFQQPQYPAGWAASQGANCPVPPSPTFAGGPSPVRVGAPLQTADGRTPLMLGSQIICQIPLGQVLTVWEVRGPWIGTSAMIDGREARGWIHVDHLASVSVVTRPSRQGEPTAR